ncbi:uncharacterized protein EMH_0035460 [Eimeria mitis]|uniref:Retrotransposon gag domain-containing protein n=1 Tax=Eimeria mitis TaxID=44415 RepID=U6JUY9_9EIME|nr:uncharacterized protein EMH_0035460 [Eimeria mitis]CDJ27852.1 hypothetical protein EMH_0035460 [Eimeria mitis]
MKIAEDQCGLLVRKYLTGRAVKQWDHVYRSGIDMTDWPLVSSRLCERFRGLPRDSMILQMRDNVWKGDYNEYSNAFSDIVIMGEELPEQDLVMFYLAGLPEDIGDKLTKRGKREFPTWNEAAAALREYVVPLNTWRAKGKRTVREMQGVERPQAREDSSSKADEEWNKNKNEGTNNVTRRPYSTERVAA